MELQFLAFSILFSSLITFVLLYLYIRYSNFFNINNKPENISKLISKKTVPTSGGIIISFVFLVLILVWYINNPKLFSSIPRLEVFIFSIIALTVISFIDDFRPINPIYRFAIQVTVVFVSLSTIETHVFQFLPLKLSVILSVYFWAYYININNFIDGIDGFEISNVIFCCLAVVLATTIMKINILEKYLAIGLLSASIPFLYFNKPSAKIFMGDSGSIFFGYIIGWIILRLISIDLWFVAIIISIYPILDVTITIFNKIIRGYKPWDRLFDYYFLQGVKNNKLTHAKTLLYFNIHNTFGIFFIYGCFYFPPIYMITLSFISSLLLLFKYKTYKI